MLNTTDDAVFIEPRPQDAIKIISNLRGCEWRGFFDNGSMVIFSGYGNTHNSIRLFFKLRNIDNPFIIQKDGNVSFDCMRGTRKIINCPWLTKTQQDFFVAIAKLCGNDEPKAQMME